MLYIFFGRYFMIEKYLLLECHVKKSPTITGYILLFNPKLFSVLSIFFTLILAFCSKNRNTLCSLCGIHPSRHKRSHAQFSRASFVLRHVCPQYCYVESVCVRLKPNGWASWARKGQDVAWRQMLFKRSH